MECRICPIVAIVSCHTLYLFFLNNAATHALLYILLCFALLLRLFIAAQINRLIRPPRSPLGGEYFPPPPLFVRTRMNKDVGEWRQSVANVSRFLREKEKRVRWADIARGANVIHDRWAGQGFHCPEIEERGNAHRCMQSRSTSDWDEKREKRQSLVDITAILNHILEIWPILIRL